jgi:PhzF family phenazine biosynthesis protein
MPSDRRPPVGAADYHHVDVFATAAYSGNSLAVFISPPPLTAGQMSTITRELRHFETIFVRRSGNEGVVDARVFDLCEELDFAGHPVLGAAAVLHALDAAADERREWTFRLPAATVQVTTNGQPDGRVAVLMAAARPELVSRLSAEDRPLIAAALGLVVDDLDEVLPPEVWSTGLRYLVVSVRDGEALVRARIAHSDLTGFLEGYGAQFAYVLDAAAVEGRHWNNDGVLEDVATGSAAGCVAAYLMRHGRARGGERLTLSQGRFVGRPSTLAITAYGTAGSIERVTVGGDVVLVGNGSLHVLPSEPGQETT